MSDLVFNAVFQDVSNTFKDQAFSTMYFGRHCGKNLLILKHDLTVMVVFGDIIQWSTPELIKAVSFRGERRKGIQIVGSENVILLLDEHGSLWKLINAFEVSTGECESFHSLKKECFYEWVPFKNFSFAKVLAITAMEQGFACLGVCENFEKKILVLPSIYSALEEYSFEELNKPDSNLFNYYLTNVKGSVFENTLPSSASETLLITDRISGKTHLCAKNGQNLLINVSTDFLISALQLQQEKCLLLCFRSGKLIFFYYGESQRQSVAYLSKKLLFIDKCCCPDTCLLWSDGVSLNHTKLTFKCGDDLIKLTHLKLNCSVQSPLSVVKINQHILTVTINNFYYSVSPGVKSGNEFRKHPQELLSEICIGSSITEELEEKIDLLSHYLHCKEIIQKCNEKGNSEIKWEGKCLAMKNCLGMPLREQLWKIQLMSSLPHRNLVHVIDLEADLSKEAVIVVRNPFKNKCRLKARLIGNFYKTDLFLNLGESDESETDFERDQFSKQIQKIFKNRSKMYIKGT